MKAFMIIIVLALLGGGGYYMWSKGMLPASKTSNVSYDGDEIIVNVGDLEARFFGSMQLMDTYMLFGGLYINHKNAVSPVSLSGLNILDAKNIYAGYPDFYKCSSPGAAQAKALIQQLDLVPADSQILATLKKAVSTFKSNIKSGGDRVCVYLTGKALDLKSLIVKAINKDVTDTMKRQHFYLVDNAEIVDCKIELED